MPFYTKLETEVIKLGKYHITSWEVKEPGSEICIFVLQVLYQPASYWKCNLFCSFFGKFSSWLPHWTPWKKKPKNRFYIPMSTIIILQFPCGRCQSTWGFSFQSVGVTGLLLNVWLHPGLPAPCTSFILCHLH